MDPVSLVVAALAAGASAGVSGSASDAVRDAYRSLRGLVRQRVARRPGGVEVLDAHHGDPAGQGDRLGSLLAATAAADAEVVAAARHLLALTGHGGNTFVVTANEARGLQIGDHNTQTITFN
jgi:hypothetical protein